MARPLRIEFPGACYHIICRGNFRFPVLREERDRELLLERLVKYAEIFRVRIRAYCLMVNHFHGYVQTEEANLWVRGAGPSEASQSGKRGAPGSALPGGNALSRSVHAF